MPWKEVSVMEERLRFVARILEGEAMSDVAREFGGSRSQRQVSPRRLIHRLRHEPKCAFNLSSVFKPRLALPCEAWS